MGEDSKNHLKEANLIMSKQQKKMNLFDLTFMAIGGIIGAGIFTMVGSGISATGRSVTLALTVGMLFQMSQQVRYVFTSAMFQVSGGMYSQDALVLTPCSPVWPAPPCSSAR